MDDSPNKPIFWDPMCEGFVDENNPDFFVDYTPEGGEPEQEFDTQEEFLRWYVETP